MTTGTLILADVSIVTRFMGTEQRSLALNTEACLRAFGNGLLCLGFEIHGCLFQLFYRPEDTEALTMFQFTSQAHIQTCLSKAPNQYIDEGGVTVHSEVELHDLDINACGLCFAYSYFRDAVKATRIMEIKLNPVALATC